MVQPTGGGCGWLDYDADGQWDLYLNQGGDPAQPASLSQPTDRLFRNVGSSYFREVTAFTGIYERDYSQGVAIGDFDNDGFDDIFVTNAGTDTLFQNQGDGTFRNVTEQSIDQPAAWSSSAAWGDLDRDGDLDLYVCRYLDFDRFDPQACFTSAGSKKMCQPNEVEAIPDELYLNEGNGTFRAVAKARGLFGDQNKSLGVAICDFNKDGWSDVYVANDATPNFLFINRQDGSFENQAMLLGCAVSWEGRSQASMGIALGDYDRNGLQDLYLSHYEGEWNTLYQNLGPQGFFDASSSVGGVSSTLPLVGFGTVMQDFNQDGWMDLIVANGHLDDPGHQRVDLAMVPQLFSVVNSKVVDNSPQAGDYFTRKSIGRGLATGDFDRDGDLDVVIVNQNSEAALLQNDSVRGNWLQLEFTGVSSNRRGIGVEVTARIEGETFVSEIAGGTSYCSSNQPCVNFGFGPLSGRCQLEILWPSGVKQRLENVSLNQSLRIAESVSTEELNPSLTTQEYLQPE